jgi:cephalosporin-C deacetylase
MSMTQKTFSAIDSYAPIVDEPSEFDRFWDATLETIRDVAPLPVMARQAPPAPGLSFDHVSFASLGNVRISAYLLAHDVPEPRPLIIHSHGYNSQYDVMLNWARMGCHIFGLDFRGFGRSTNTRVGAGGYVLTGIESPQASILRGAVCDLLQGLKAANVLLGWRIARTILYGFSFGGAMALMAGALTDEPELLVVGQPTFGWHKERLRLSKAGSSHELNRYLAAHPESRAGVLGTLDYFDTLHFAPRIRMPVLIGVGLDDDVVPSRSVLAIANRLPPASSEMRFLPVAHSDDPRESLWADFDTEWLGLARDGLPGDFGSETRRFATVERATA